MLKYNDIYFTLGVDKRIRIWYYINMSRKENIKAERIASGTYEITLNGRTFDVSYSENLKEWKIYENGEWWETTSTLKDAKEYIRGV